MTESTAPYSADAESHLVRGGAGTGKTELIVSTTCNLVNDGVPTDSIAVFAATPLACGELAERFARRLGPDAELPAIKTVSEHALALLGSAPATASTGRSPRVLMRFEEAFLMEDLKTTGVLPHRLKEMLRFFYRSMTELEPMEDGWFFDDDEKRVYTSLQQCLKHYGAYVAAEVSRTAYALASGSLETYDAFRFDYVFVDDYQMLGKAAQCLAGVFARKELWVAGDANAAVCATEEFPYPDGLECFPKANPGCSVLELGKSHACRQVVKAVNALCKDPDFNAPELDVGTDAEGSCEIICFHTPADELEAVADLVEASICSGISPEQIAVAASSGSWARGVMKALVRKGVEARTADQLALNGDFRDVAQCEELRIVALVNLVANPRDQLALRCWCGFDDHLANSGFFARAAREGRVLALDCADGMGVFGQSKLMAAEYAKIAAALRQARECVHALSGATGTDLIVQAASLVGADPFGNGAAQLRALVAQLPRDASAQQIAQHIRLNENVAHAGGTGVFVGVAEAFAGLSFHTVVFSGLVNGLVPKRSYFDPTMVERDKRPAILSAELAKAYCCVGKATDRLVISYFEEAELGLSERLKLKVSRVRLRNGKRMCEVSPSEVVRGITGVRFDG